MGPGVLLMDAAFSALGPLIRKDMQRELIVLQRDLKMTIIFITHDLHEALLLGDQVAIMKDGRFVQVGSPEDIVGEPADDYVSAFTQDVDRGRVFTVGSIMEGPVAADGAKDSPKAALERMRELGWQGLIVTDGDAGTAFAWLAAGRFGTATTTGRAGRARGRRRGGVRPRNRHEPPWVPGRRRAHRHGCGGRGDTVSSPIDCMLFLPNENHSRSGNTMATCGSSTAKESSPAPPPVHRADPSAPTPPRGPRPLSPG